MKVSVGLAPRQNKVIAKPAVFVARDLQFPRRHECPHVDIDGSVVHFQKDVGIAEIPQHIFLGHVMQDLLVFEYLAYIHFRLMSSAVCGSPRHLRRSRKIPDAQVAGGQLLERVRMRACRRYLQYILIVGQM